MTPAALEALALRSEQANGPDRVIDYAIGYVLGAHAVVPDDHRFIMAGSRIDKQVPAYTASLDAALSLVPEGHTVQLSDWDHQLLRDKGPWQAIVLPMGARGAMQRFTFTNRCDHAATPALALTVAALRSRAAILRQEQGA